MNNNTLRTLGKLLASLFGLFVVGFVVILAIKSYSVQPTSGYAYLVPNGSGSTIYSSPVNSGVSAYPGPISPKPTPSLSPEEICDRSYSFRKSLSRDRRKPFDDAYNGCVNAWKTPAPKGVVKPTVEIPNGDHTSPFYSHEAGNGVIIEANYSRLPSIFRVENQWTANLDGYNVIVYAGGKKNETIGGEALKENLSWPGILFVTVMDADGKYLREKSGEYLTPENFGPVRIVDAHGSTLTVVTHDGNPFTFDVVKREYLPVKAGTVISRTVGTGTLVESGKSPFEDYTFRNQWSYTNKEGSTITVFAGNERVDSNKGALVVSRSPADDSSKIEDAVVYKPDLDRGTLRIVYVKGEKLTIVSVYGAIYEFDLVSGQFISTKDKTGPFPATPILLRTPASTPTGDSIP